MARTTKPKATDPLADLANGLAADHATKKNKGEVNVAAPAPGEEAAAEQAPEPAPEVEQPAASVTIDDGMAEAVAAVAEEPVEASEASDVAHDRRMERLLNIAREAEFESGTALGDMVDVTLDLFKHRPKVWSAMSQGEQQDVIRTIQAAQKIALEKVVIAIAEEGLDSIAATLDKKFTKDGDKIKIAIVIDHADIEELVEVSKLAGQRVIITSADRRNFDKVRKEPQTDPDQPALFAPVKQFVSTPVAPPAHPDDDSDLAGGQAEDEAGNDAEPPIADETADSTDTTQTVASPSEEPQPELNAEAADEPAPPYLVYDHAAEVYLAPKGHDEDWIEDPASAWRFDALEDAKKAALVFGEEDEFHYPNAEGAISAKN